jgi:hypothetical protein
VTVLKNQNIFMPHHTRNRTRYASRTLAYTHPETHTQDKFTYASVHLAKVWSPFSHKNVPKGQNESGEGEHRESAMLYVHVGMSGYDRPGSHSGRLVRVCHTSRNVMFTGAVAWPRGILTTKLLNV